MVISDHILLICAFVCFIFATFSIPARINWVGLGLAFWVGSLLT